MPQIQLTPAERRAQRAEAHFLDPVVSIGANGLTPAVEKEIDMALSAHGLIKVRMFNAERAERQALFLQLADTLHAAPVQHIGKLLVFWRPVAAQERAADAARKPGPRAVKVLKFSKRPGQKPEVRHLRILGNQRLSAGGQIKRAKPRQISIKKRNNP